MGLLIAIVGLSILSILLFVSSRRRVTPRVEPMSRRRVALIVAIGATMVAAGLLLFPFVWWAFFPHCCNP